MARVRWLIIALCLLGFFGGSFMLWRDLQGEGGGAGGTPVGRVEKREARVRHRPPSRLTWSNLRESQELYRRESIQTGPASTAIIRLSDGAILEVGENSLVILDDTQDLALNFLAGSAVLRKQQGDSRISRDRGGGAKFEDLPVRLLRPEALSEIYVSDRVPRAVALAWETRDPAKAAGLAVQVSSDSAFRARAAGPAAGGPLRREFGETQTGEAAPLLAPGRWFWRVAGKAGPLSETLSFRVVLAQALQPVWPAAGQKVATWGKDAAVQFRWIAPADGSERAEHVLEVARDAGFREVLASQPVTAAAGSAAVRALPEGELSWRIRSRYGALAAVSAAERFKLERASKLGIELAVPEEGSSFELQPRVRFTWNSDSVGAVEYAWELQAADGKPVSTARSLATTNLWTTPADGAFRWRVTALLAGQVVGESEWRRFSIFRGAPIALLAPSQDQKLAFWDSPPAFDFKWEPDPIADQPGFNYSVDVAEDRDFRVKLGSVKLREAQFPRERVKLAAGSHFWRVRVVDPSGQVVKTSPVGRFYFGLPPPLGAPMPVAPAVGEVLNPVQSEQDPVLTWNPVEGAAAYEVVVRVPASAGGRTDVRQLVEKPTFGQGGELKGLGEGRYTWSVRAIDRKRRLGLPSAARQFKVDFGAPLAAPLSTSPEVQ